MATGMIIGGCKDEPGGWGEYLLAHESQVVKIPQYIPDLTAVLIEPLSVGLHAVLKKPPPKGSKVLVIGGGIMSYSIVIALKFLGISCHITHVLFTYQQDMGMVFGVDEGICKEAGNDVAGRVCEITGARSQKPTIGERVFTGGFDYVYDCIGSQKSLSDALRLTRERGFVILVGTPGQIPSLDLTFVWQKELSRDKRA